MRKPIKAIAISVAALAMAAAPLSAANAQRWHRHHHGYYGHRYHHHGYGGGAAAGIIGLAAGAIIGGAIAESQRPREYVGSIEPWTQAWYQYCSRSYRSFNPRTGNFTGYDGRAHFCVAR